MCFALVFGHRPQSLRVCARLPKQNNRTTLSRSHFASTDAINESKLANHCRVTKHLVDNKALQGRGSQLVRLATCRLAALSALLLASCPPPAPTGHNCTSRQYKSAENQAIKPTWSLRGVQNPIVSVFGLECHCYSIHIWYGAVPEVLVFCRTYVWFLPCHVHSRTWYVCSNYAHQLC